MTLRRAWPALAALAAVALALAAYAVLAAAGAARSGAPPGPLAGAGEAALATRDDRQLAYALRLVAAAARPGLAPGAAERARGAAETALQQAALAGRPAQRALARNLFAVLALQDAHVDKANAQRHVADAIAALRAAVTADPSVEDAKFNLELLLSLHAKGNPAGARTAPRRGAAGAGARRAGAGY